jgi:two-component system, LuxR family, response regulator FixJ
LYCRLFKENNINKQATVFVVDDDEAVGESISFLVQSIGLRAKAFLTATQFLGAYKGEPGCLVLDVRMPEMSGLELQRYMKIHGVLLPIVFLTGHGDVPMAVDAMKLGALNFMAKPFSGQALLDNVHEAIKKDEELRAKRENHNGVLQRIALLTKREHEVMRLVIQGLRSKAVGEALDISTKTVELHRNRIMEKMQVSSSVELATLVAGVEEPVG